LDLEAILLADYAVLVEGKLNIQGGGINEVRAPQFPWVHPQLSLVVRFRLEPDEAPADHTLNVRVVAPDTHFVVPPTDISLSAGGVVLTGVDRFVQAVVSFAPVPFSAPGTHRVEVALDGMPLRALAVDVSLQA